MTWGDCDPGPSSLGERKQISFQSLLQAAAGRERKGLSILQKWGETGLNLASRNTHKWWQEVIFSLGNWDLSQLYDYMYLCPKHFGGRSSLEITVLNNCQLCQPPAQQQVVPRFSLSGTSVHSGAPVETARLPCFWPVVVIISQHNLSSTLCVPGHLIVFKLSIFSKFNFQKLAVVLVGQI